MASRKRLANGKPKATGMRPTGMRQGLATYGDAGFSLFLRKAFIKAGGYSDDALDRPIVGITNTFSDYNPCHGNVPDLIERITAWANETYRLADPKPAGAETCMYTTTADETFILERRSRVVVGSPCSGHGFKFAPAIGERLAALALEA